MVQALRPVQDWLWCYVDEVTMRPAGGGWVEVDLFFEIGLGYMREHLEAGGNPNVDEDFTFGKGFPLGRWVAEMRRRRAAGELDAERADRRAAGLAPGRVNEATSDGSGSVPGPVRLRSRSTRARARAP
jgi:hypothetical protein